MGRQGQPRGAQVYAMQLSGQKGWSQDPPFPRFHLRVGSAGEGVLLQFFVYLRPLKVSRFFCFCTVAVAFEQILLCCSPGLCYSAVVAVLFILLHLPNPDKLEIFAGWS